MSWWFGKACKYQGCMWEQDGICYNDTPSLVHCSHKDNPHDWEGNCNHKDCPTLTLDERTRALAAERQINQLTYERDKVAAERDKAEERVTEMEVKYDAAHEISKIARSVNELESLLVALVDRLEYVHCRTQCGWNQGECKDCYTHELVKRAREIQFGE